MSKVTDALVIVNPASILTDHGKNDDYVSLKNQGLGYVFTVAPFSDIAQTTDKNDVSAQQAQDHQEEEGGDDIKLIIHVGDVARFRSVPLGWRSDYQCFIDQIAVDPAETRITPATSVCRCVSATDLDSTAAPFTQYMPAAETDYYHEMATLRSGTVKFTVNFSIYDNNAQRLGGYRFQSQMAIEA
jgi:hypothetical protein